MKKVSVIFYDNFFYYMTKLNTTVLNIFILQCIIMFKIEKITRCTMETKIALSDCHERLTFMPIIILQHPQHF